MYSLHLTKFSGQNRSYLFSIDYTVGKNNKHLETVRRFLHLWSFAGGTVELKIFCLAPYIYLDVRKELSKSRPVLVITKQRVTQILLGPLRVSEVQ